MKIALITINTPASNNIGGTSALPYHLLIKRPEDIEVVVYSFNYNGISTRMIAEIEKELNLKINLLQQSKYVNDVLQSKYGAVKRIFSRYPLHYYTKLAETEITQIKSQNPDGIWIYGEELGQVSKQFCNFKRVHCFPDSEALYYKRMMEQIFVKSSFTIYIRQWLMRPKYERMEREMDSSDNVHYYLVGKEDTDNLKRLCPNANAHFICHPHYNVNLNHNHNLNGSNKIKLLVAGRYDLYMKHDADLMVEAMVNRADLQQHYAITFLGKGWESIISRLKETGYDVDHITFVDDYIGEICKYDIQLAPLSIGTGTKGKVLDALANGLLVIGTWFALENVAVKSGESCIEYHSAHELMDVLAEIPNHRDKYKAMAETGRKAVLTEHAREKCSKQMFDLFR